MQQFTEIHLKFTAIHLKFTAIHLNAREIHENFNRKGTEIEAYFPELTPRRGPLTVTVTAATGLMRQLFKSLDGFFFRRRLIC